MFTLKSFIISSSLLGLFVASLCLGQDALPPSNEFLAPNEVNPELAIPILVNAPAGAYGTVGTERGFIHASEAAQITELYFVDRADGTILYDRINTELLRATWKHGLSIQENRERYVSFRLELGFEDWKKIGQHFMSEKKYFDWFTKAVRGRAFLDFNTPPKTSHLAAFRKSNYLFDDQKFAKIQQMALDGKIHSHQLDLGSNGGELNKKGVENFLTQLEREKIHLSVFDLSNAWSKKYLGPENTAKLAEILAASRMVGPDSLFLVTDYRRTQFYKNGERAKPGWFTMQATIHETNSHYEYDWEYHAYSFGYLSSNPMLKILNSPLPKGSSLNNDVVGCDDLLLR